MLSNQVLTKFILAILAIVFVLEIISIGVLSTSLNYIYQIKNGYEVGYDFFFALLEQYGDGLDAVYRLSLVFLGILFLFWVYKAHKNLRLLGENNLNYSDASCVWWFFVPIACLWKPYSALKETLIRSYSLANSPLSTNIVLLVWWLLLIIGSVLGKVLMKAPEPTTLSGSISLIQLSLFSYLLSVLSSILLFKIIYNINKMQQIAFNNQSTPKVSLQKS